MVLLYVLFILGTIFFLLFLGRRAEQQKVLMRKRAAVISKTKSRNLNEEECDIAIEVLGTQQQREVKVKELECLKDNLSRLN